MSWIADVLFLAVVLALLGVIVWKALGVSTTARRGRRTSDANAPQDSTGGVQPSATQSRCRSDLGDGDGGDSGGDGGGDGGGGGGGGGGD